MVRGYRGYITLAVSKQELEASKTKILATRELKLSFASEKTSTKRDCLSTSIQGADNKLGQFLSQDI